MWKAEKVIYNAVLPVYGNISWSTIITLCNLWVYEIAELMMVLNPGLLNCQMELSCSVLITFLYEMPIYQDPCARPTFNLAHAVNPL